MEQKLTHIAEGTFCKENCKECQSCKKEEVIIEVTNEQKPEQNFQCSPDKCWECSNVLC